MTSASALQPVPPSTLSDAFIDTARKHRQTVRLFIACHALSRSMLDAVEREVWLTAAGLPGTAAMTEMRGRLLEHAATIIAKQLEALVRQAISGRDALLHGLAQTSLESLQQRSDFNAQLGQQIQARHRTLDPGSRELLKARYQEHSSTSTIATGKGWNQARVDEHLLFARAAVDWSAPLEPTALSGRGLPTLVETYLAGTIDARARLQLAKLALGDLAVKSQFERQVRLDLVLGEMVHESSEVQLRRFLAELTAPAPAPPAPPAGSPGVGVAASSVTFGSRIGTHVITRPATAPAPAPEAAPTASPPADPADASVPPPAAIRKPETRRISRPGLPPSHRPGAVRRRGPPPLLLAGAGIILVLVVAGLIHALRPGAATAVRTHGDSTDESAALAHAEPSAAPHPPVSRPAAPPGTQEAPSPSAQAADPAPPRASDQATSALIAATPADDLPRPRDLTVWVAGDPARANGWSWPKEPLTLSPAVAANVVHQGRSVLHMHTEGGKVAVWGWNWLGWYPPEGTDISGMKELLVAVRIDGADKPTSVRLGLDCSARKTTKEYELMPHYAGLTDGGWHEVAVPLAEIVSGSEFDPHQAWELKLIVEAAAPVKADIYIDDIGFAR
jgi:hypothetical protein